MLLYGEEGRAVSTHIVRDDFAERQACRSRSNSLRAFSAYERCKLRRLRRRYTDSTLKGLGLQRICTAVVGFVDRRLESGTRQTH